MRGIIYLPHYRILRELAIRPQSQTYHCESLADGAQCVLKTYEPDSPNTEPDELWRNPHRELMFLQSSLHRSIPRLIDFGKIPGARNCYSAIEYAPGIPLDVAAQSASKEQLLVLLTECCSSLEYIHRRGFVHGDLKPEHVLVRLPTDSSSRPSISLIDFEAIQACDSHDAETIKTTPQYAAPELLLERQVTRAADIYSLGMTILKCLPLAHHDTGRDLIPRTAANSLSPSSPIGGFERDLSDLARVLVSPEPWRRPQSAAEVARRIQELAHSYSIQIEIDSQWQSYCSGQPQVSSPSRATLLLESILGYRQAMPSTMIEVHGPPGYGKTTLISSLSAVIATRPGRTILQARSHRVLTIISQYIMQGGTCPDVLALDITAIELPAALRTLLQVCSGTRAPQVILLSVPTNTSFSDDEAEALSTLRRRYSSTPIALGSLDSVEIAFAVRNALGVHSIPRTLPSHLLSVSGGSPARMWASLAYLFECRAMSIAGSSLEKAAPLDQTFDTPLPDPHIASLLMSEPIHSRLVAELLSVTPLPVTDTLVSRLCGLAPVELRESCRRLISLGLIEEHLTDSDRYLCVSGELLRVSIKSSVSRDHRIRMQRAIAQHFMNSSRSPSVLFDVGALYEESSSPELAATAYSQAATLARASGAYELAIKSLKAALQVVSSQDPSSFALTLDLASSLASAGRHREALDVNLGLESDQSCPPDMVARHHLQLSQCHYLLGQFLSSARHARQALASSIRASRIDLRIASLLRLGSALSWSDDRSGGNRYLLQALLLARRSHQATLAEDGLRELASSHWKNGNYRLALNYERRRLALLRLKGEPQVITYALQNVGVLLADLGRFDVAREHYRRALHIARSIQNEAAVGSCLVNLAELYRIQGMNRIATSATRAALRRFRVVGPIPPSAVAKANLALVLMRTGSFTEARTLLVHALSREEVRQSTQTRVMLLHGWSQLLYLYGACDTSLRVALYSLRLARQAGLGHLELDSAYLVSQSLIATGQLDRASELLANTRSTHAARSSVESVLWSEYLTAQVRLLKQGPGGEAYALSDALLHRASQYGLASLIGYAEVLRGDILLQRGVLGDAENSASAARASSMKCSDQVLSWTADALLGSIHERQLRYPRALAAYRRAAHTILAIANGILPTRYRDTFLNRPNITSLRVAFRRVGSESRRRSRYNIAALRRGESISRKMLASLSEIGQKLTSTNTLEELLGRILDLAIDNVSAERGLVFLRCSHDGTLRISSARGVRHTDLDDLTSFSRSVVGRAAEGDTVHTMDIGEDPVLSSVPSIIVKEIKSVLCVPMKSRGHVLGVIYLDTRKKGEVFTHKERTFVESFASQAAIAIDNARVFGRMREENARLRREAEGRFPELVGTSGPMRQLQKLIAGVLEADCTVLITGESGTGKGIIARAIHAHGPRREGPFLTVDCGALPESLLEGELFGYKRGAFTGAERDRVGLLEEANGGTLFLDEITNTSTGLQARLLRVLQERDVRRLGENQSRRVNVRVIAATNADLPSLISQGRFRQDLYYRLNVITLAAPPLRDRREDIPLLVSSFLGRYARDGKPVRLLGPGVMEALQCHPWPGNVRELENLMERIVILSQHEIITVADLPESLRPGRMSESPEHPNDGASANASGLPQRLITVDGKGGLRSYGIAQKTGEQIMIEDALCRFQGDKTKAARFIGWNRQKLYRRIKSFSIPVDFGKAA